jgi:ATP-dependent DNA helicase RecQ
VRPRTKDAYRELLERSQRVDASGIIYCQSRKRVDEVTEALRADGVSALPYHAGLPPGERQANQDAFIRDDARVMVATVAFGMGVNKPDVRWVAHYDLPRTLESYYQESGRAGRDGDPAECVLYFSPADIRTADFMIQQKIDPVSGEPLADEQRIARQQLRQVLGYAESTECRRAVQLRYFGEEFSPPCGACDNCIEPLELQDWTTPAQQLLSCVARLAQRRERYGAAHVIDILRGSESQRLIDRGHAQLSVYGIGRGCSIAQWRDLTRALLHQGAIAETQDGYPVLMLNERSWEILRGQRTVQFAVRPKPKRRRAISAAGSPLDDALFQKLRMHRKQAADAAGVPPYVVFHDATLREMAQRSPRSPAEFALLPGVGRSKLERYADSFTRVIREHHDGGT